MTRLETEPKRVGTDIDKHLRLVTSMPGVLQGRCSSNLQIRKQLKVTSYWATKAAAEHASLTPRSGLCSLWGRRPSSHIPRSLCLVPLSKTALPGGFGCLALRSLSVTLRGCVSMDTIGPQSCAERRVLAVLFLVSGPHRYPGIRRVCFSL